ncbi:hypothetical protein M407DRAFT_29836 [Tulasnella calospora MUT 4182]|uniref:SAP domain-containing protein n=1 Tax=Tulasnella calospora MUT 4182 TaxID=1051891 RepID=A0A0C3PYS4_9AGAM|nr:hypothetical protein M407DRAFT_29836 [Tulasnella calospora MUT 4182]
MSSPTMHSHAPPAPNHSASSPLSGTGQSVAVYPGLGLTPQPGSWTETASYRYFGTAFHAEMASSLLIATGRACSLLDSNPSFATAGLSMLSGNQQSFDYGDLGLIKYSATATKHGLKANGGKEHLVQQLATYFEDQAAPSTSRTTGSTSQSYKRRLVDHE